LLKNNINTEFSKQWWKDTLELDEIKVIPKITPEIFMKIWGNWGFPIAKNTEEAEKEWELLVNKYIKIDDTPDSFSKEASPSMLAKFVHDILNFQEKYDILNNQIIDEIKIISDKNKIPIIKRSKYIQVEYLGYKYNSRDINYNPQYYIIGFIEGTDASNTHLFKYLKDKYPYISSNKNTIYIPKSMVVFQNKEIDEIKVVRFPKTWNLDKPGINPDKILPRDILQFTIYSKPDSTEIVKQVFIRYNALNSEMLVTRDLSKNGLPDEEGGWDYWLKDDIKNHYWNHKSGHPKPSRHPKPLEEIKIISPNNITPENIYKLYLNKRDNGSLDIIIKYGWFKQNIHDTILPWLNYLPKETLVNIYKDLISLNEIKVLGGRTNTLMIKYNNIINKLDEIGEIYGENSYYVRQLTNYPKMELGKNELTLKEVENNLQKIKTNIKNIIKEYYYDKRRNNQRTDFGLLKIKEIYENDLGGEEIFYESKDQKLYKSQKDEYNKCYVNLLGELVKYCCKELKIPIPKIKIINNSSYTNNNKSYGGYFPSDNQIYTVILDRTLADSMRTLSHEIYHSYQHYNKQIKPESGKDGDNIENAANSYSGKIMRIFGKKHPEIFFMKYMS